jgi:S1-C subfamily serine protease
MRKVLQQFQTNFRLENMCDMPSRTDECIATLESCVQATVQIIVGQTWASGVIISPNGYILTNAHVMQPYIADNKKIYSTINVKVNQGGEETEYVAKAWIVTTTFWDIALLKLQLDHPRRTFEYLRLANTS